MDDSTDLRNRPQSEVSETGIARSAHPLRRTWRRWLLQKLVSFTVLFTLYALSIGPMFWYWWDAVYVGGPSWVYLFYGPLVILAEYCPPFRDLINVYINWWIL